MISDDSDETLVNKSYSLKKLRAGTRGNKIYIFLEIKNKTQK